MRHILYKLLDSLFSIIIAVAVPLCWGIGIGVVVGSGMTSHGFNKSVSQDCHIMGMFRINETSFYCEPRRKNEGKK